MFCKSFSYYISNFNYNNLIKMIAYISIKASEKLYFSKILIIGLNISFSTQIKTKPSIIKFFDNFVVN